MDSLSQAEEALRLDKLTEAEASLKQVLEREPDNLRALIAWGVVGLRLKNFSQAQSAFERVLTLSPDNQQSRKNLVIAILSGPRPELARPHLETLLAQNQNDYQLWAMLSQVEKTVGNLAASQEAGEKSLLLNPAQPGLRAWLNSLAQPAEAKPSTRPRVTQLTFLCPPGQEGEIDLLGAYLDRSLTVKKVVSLREDPYLAALSGRTALWVEGLNPRSAPWLARLTPGPRPIILRLGPEDLVDPTTFSLGAVNGVLAETKAILELFLAKGARLADGAKLLIAPRAQDFSRIDLSRIQAASSAPTEPTGGESAALAGSTEAASGDPKQPLSLAYLGPWNEPGLTLEAFKLVRERDPQATLWSLLRPKSMELARQVDYYLAKNGLAGKVFFSGPSLGREDFFKGRTHVLATWGLAGGVEVPQALAHGLKPLIRDCPGAGELFPPDYLWAGLGDLPGLLAGAPAEAPAAWAKRLSSVATLAEKVLSLLG
ncbi:MAG: hypothetical protein LBR11_09470 [Deltaproteobacteria bacterium]|jgi:hypothetical protein|nr:hypothetical protein [Deltaproteobacteria bacterium]